MTPTVADIDVTNCDQEPIHLSGAIQSYGIFLALEPLHLRILAASENIAAHFGAAPLDFIGDAIGDLLGPANEELIRSAASRAEIEDVNPLKIDVCVRDAAVTFDLVLHRTSDAIIVELEPVGQSAPVSPAQFTRTVRASMDALAAARTVEDLCEAAVDEVAAITGFDRVMVYRFDVDWHGEVVAERRALDLEPFLGLHFPASDIPRQARAVFTQNWLRFIPDVDAQRSEIVPRLSPRGEAFDLSRSMLRSVSPVHLEYLRNMNVAATMTVSLLKNGELWGLIACHHRSPKMLTYQLRLACEMVGRTMTLALGTLEVAANMIYRTSLEASQLRLLAALSRPTDMWQALASAEPHLLALVGAEGAAIRFGNDCRLVGRTPELADVVAITDWLTARESDDIFVSDALPLIEPAFERFAASACGIIAFTLSRARRSYILWFRPETPLTVSWGGDPRKGAQPAPGGVTLSPRLSFAAWSEIVHHHSSPWTAYEVDVAREWCRFVGTLIVDRAVDRAEELERANRELEVTNRELASLLRSNVELDSFAHIASHDLKEPLRGIHNYASFLVEDYGSVVGEDGRDKLETLVRLSRRMEALIDSLLALSSIGRAEFTDRPVNLHQVIDEVVELHMPMLAQRGGEVVVVTPLPLVYVDSVRLGQVFNNLFSNAVKYSERPPRIEVGCHPTKTPPLPPIDEAPALVTRRAGFTTIFVRDNGIGIRQKHLASIFQMFKRLHSAEAFGGGTGAGLAISKKIIERHGGQMWAESSFGNGTTFFFTLPTEL